jgi:hypothetical protein
MRIRDGEGEITQIKLRESILKFGTISTGSSSAMNSICGKKKQQPSINNHAKICKSCVERREGTSSGENRDMFESD